MIEGEKLIAKIKELKVKYCTYWQEKPEGDTFSGFHGYMDMLLSEAIKYGYEQGESFGRYEKYAEQVTNQYLIQPENDRAWQEELEDIKSSTSPDNIQVRLLALIAEMILYTRRGG